MGCVAQCDFWLPDILQGCSIVQCKMQYFALETTLNFSREPYDIRMGYSLESRLTRDSNVAISC